MKTRAFSLTEVIVVLAIAGVSSGLALQGLSDSVTTAKARSQRAALVRAVKLERQHSVEQLQPLAMRAAGDQIAFHRATIALDKDGDPTGCTVGAQLDVQRYPQLKLAMQNGGTLCLDEDGRPVDDAVAIGVAADDDHDGAIAVEETGAIAFAHGGTATLSGNLSPDGLDEGQAAAGNTLTKKSGKKLKEKKHGKKGHGKGEDD
jgi:prepilin-type N-terminal cleavage/methylation domain-containing protein